MTLPTTTQLNSPDDDSDMFGPPRSSPPIGYHHQRSRVPMISPKLRQREERKRILQLCAHKLERIKDSETNLRRSVCINNTFSRLTDEVRREKQSRYLANLPKSSDNKPETARDNMFNPYSTPPHCINYSNPMELRCDHYQNIHQHHTWTGKPTAYTPACCSNNNNNTNNTSLSSSSGTTNLGALSSCRLSTPTPPPTNDRNHCSSTTSVTSSSLTTLTSSPSPSSSSSSSYISNNNLGITNSVDTDLELLDRELNAINASMPLIDPEIQHGAEQLEKAISSRKRSSSSSSLSSLSLSTSRTEEENDRLVREALSQFYLPTQRLISAIDDCPLDIKRSKLTTTNDLDLDLNLDLNQNQKEFEVIMDALRLSTSSPTPSASDSCGQAAMSESGVFHNLVVTSLET